MRLLLTIAACCRALDRFAVTDLGGDARGSAPPDQGSGAATPEAENEWLAAAIDLDSAFFAARSAAATTEMDVEPASQSVCGQLTTPLLSE